MHTSDIFFTHFVCRLALFALKSATFGEKGILRLNLKEAIVDMLSIALPKVIMIIF